MKKNFPLRWLVTLFALGLSCYFLYYSVIYYSKNPSAQKILAENIPDLNKKIVNLGLDLQGGMRLVIEIDKSHLSEEEKKDVLDRTYTVISNRVNGLGVAEPIVQKQGENRLIIELPGLQDSERAKKVLGNTAILEFKLVREPASLQKALDIIDKALIGEVTNSKQDSISDSKKSKEERLAESIFGDKDIDSSADTTEAMFSSKHPFSSQLVPIGSDIGAEERYKKRIDEMLANPAVKEALKLSALGGSVFLWGNETESFSGKKFRRLYYLKKKPEMTGALVADALASISSGGLQAGNAVVNLKLKSKGIRKFSRITEANINKRLAIVLDNTVYSAPVIRSKISTGDAQISGMSNMEEARDLSIVLRAGALPAPAKVVEERTVGPTLGKSSIRASLISAIISFIIIIVFMAIYYGFMGLVADAALILNMILLFAFMAATNSTLTLPGVAGLILILGIAVDANVLINERIREELKAGKTVKSAIAAGYSRALTVIFDANLTTVATGVILFNYGTGPIKGFALTLSAGVIINMFTSLFITKLLAETYCDKFNVKNLSIGKLTFFKKPDFSIIGLRKIGAILSSVIIIIGLGSIVIKGGLNSGIDFKGGNMLLVKFDNSKDIKIPTIKKEISKVVDGTPEIKYVGKQKDNTIQVMVQSQEKNVGKIVKDKLSQLFPQKNQFDLLKEELVGPRIGKELKWNALIAIILSVLFLIAYLAWRFKQISYGLGAVAALTHDIAIGIGMLSITGREFSLPIVAALLTILGYSVNDTIVIFDRVRENLRTEKNRNILERIFDISINQNLNRTILTSLTTFLVVIVLFVFGGQSINDFAFVILVGIVSGTYSSIFIASPVVLMWHKKRKKQK